MTKNNLLKTSSVALIVGFSFIGFGVGQLFCQGFLGLIIGSGIGLILFALTMFRIIKRMDIYNKTKI